MVLKQVSTMSVDTGGDVETGKFPHINEGTGESLISCTSTVSGWGKIFFALSVPTWAFGGQRIPTWFQGRDVDFVSKSH